MMRNVAAAAASVRESTCLFCLRRVAAKKVASDLNKFAAKSFSSERKKTCPFDEQGGRGQIF